MATSSKRKIVRSKYAGVFFGEVVEDDRSTNTAVLVNARRLWYWNGAASLSQLAQSGTTKPASCKFPETVDRIEVREVIEILDVTPVAAKTIDSVPVWSA